MSRERKVFLENLPKDKRDRVDWKRSVGFTVNFIYWDIEGKFEIVDYIRNNNKGYLIIKYNNVVSEPIWTGRIINCEIGKFLKKRTGEFKYYIGQRKTCCVCK